MTMKQARFWARLINASRRSKLSKNAVEWLAIVIMRNPKKFKRAFFKKHTDIRKLVKLIDKMNAA